MQAAGIPEGYKSITELAEWPREKLIAIFGAGSPSGASQRRRRFESVLQYGMMMHTDFTGKGSVEQAMRMLGVTAEEPTRNTFQGVARVM
jgi:ABC-type polysaccharide/polyol phosphate transport system ATPase subunit